jgi:alcohol dehydrogenase (NADP+)
MECAFVGCGAVARKYAATLDDAALSVGAVCDLDPDRAADFATDCGARAYTDLDAMLGAEAAPLLLNCTSHGAHATVTERALRADRHVWSEKPLALDADRARELVALAERRSTTAVRPSDSCGRRSTTAVSVGCDWPTPTPTSAA